MLFEIFTYMFSVHLCETDSIFSSFWVFQPSTYCRKLYFRTNKNLVLKINVILSSISLIILASLSSFAFQQVSRTHLILKILKHYPCKNHVLPVLIKLYLPSCCQNENNNNNILHIQCVIVLISAKCESFKLLRDDTHKHT